MISRLLASFWSLCFLIYSQTLLTTSVRGSGSDPTTAASSFDGVNGFEKALGAPATFGFAVLVAGAFFGAAVAAALAAGFLAGSFMRFPSDTLGRSRCL